MAEGRANFGLDLRELKPEENLYDLGVIDSMGIVRLISFVENRFGIKISNEDNIPENFQTLNHLKKLIE